MVRSDEHESSEGDCDKVEQDLSNQDATLSDEHESSEGDCDSTLTHVRRFEELVR